MKKIFNKINKAYLCLVLLYKKRQQVQTFFKLRDQARVFAQDLTAAGIDQYVIDQWKNNYKKIEKIFLEKFPFNFLNIATIKYTMFVSKTKWTGIELDYLKSRLNISELKELLFEDAVGNPEIIDGRLLTSANSVHHLYHLVKYQEATGIDIQDINTVIEWGGGYGNFAKIFNRLKKGSSTYIMIDLPIFCVLQWLYLAVTIGQNQVKLIADKNDRLEENKINMLPVNYINNFDIKGDMFVSTWALSESAAFAQDLAEQKGLLNAPHLLLAYQESNIDFPTASRLEDIITGEKNIIDIGFIKSKYLFR